MIRHDHKTHVWIAASQDIPGLVLESDSYKILLERVKMAKPEFTEINEGAQVFSAIGSSMMIKKPVCVLSRSKQIIQKKPTIKSCWAFTTETKS